MATAPAIGLLGDVMLGRGVAKVLEQAEPRELWSEELRALCHSLDLVVANLECCLSAGGAPTTLVPRKPFFFRGPPRAVDALSAIGVRAVSLANNHVLDYGPAALIDTTELLGAARIAAPGAGVNAAAARRGAVVDAAGVSVGLVAVTDHPRQYAAAEHGPGTAYAHLHEGAPTWLLDEIARLRASCDLVVAFAHWGPNMAPAPASWQHAVAAELQEAGADLVAGHSAHVFHGVGWSAAGPLLFDLGDALDDYRIDARLRNDLGLLAIWRPLAAPAEQVELVGLRLEYAFTRLADGTDADWIAARLRAACAEFGTTVERRAEQRFAVFPEGLHRAP